MAGLRGVCSGMSVFDSRFMGSGEKDLGDMDFGFMDLGDTDFE